MTTGAHGPEDAGRPGSPTPVEGQQPEDSGPDAPHPDLRPFGRRPSPWAYRGGGQGVQSGESNPPAGESGDSRPESTSTPPVPFGTVTPSAPIPSRDAPATPTSGLPPATGPAMGHVSGVTPPPPVASAAYGDDPALASVGDQPDAVASGPAPDASDGAEIEDLEIAIARTAAPGAAGVEINVSEALVPESDPLPVPVIGVEGSGGELEGLEIAIAETAAPGAAGVEINVSEALANGSGATTTDAPEGAPAPPVRPLSRAEQRAGGGGGVDYEEYELPTVIAIANQKGGVGKTTTSVNLGAGLAELGFRVLVVDLDPQGNATTGLGINARNLQNSIYDVLMHDLPIEDCVEPTSLKNLFVAPATIDLAGAEIELVPAFSRELKLKRALQEARDDYDFALIDCPPSLGLLTVNGLAAADAVIVPIQCEYYALEGLGQLLRNVALVRTNLNPTLDVRGIVLTMYDARTKLSDQVEQEVREHFGPKVYRTVVPRTVRLSEAPSFGQPIIIFDSTSRGAIAYRELSKEVCRGAKRRTG
jgi:chromosome partitioning protein